MDLLLDMKTIFITLVIGHLFSSIVITAYWQNHKNDPVLNGFLLAKCTQAVSWLMFAIRGGIPDVLTISLANSLLIIGASLEVIAILKIQNYYNRAFKKFYGFMTILIIVAFHMVIVIYNVESARIAVASFGIAVLAIIPAYLLLTEKGATYLSKIMGFTYLLTSASLVSRGLSAIYSDGSMGLFTAGINQTIAFLVIYLVMILSNTGFVLLFKQKTDDELLYLASYDDLTKALNRRTFIQKAEQLLKAYSKEQKPVSYMLFDIDYFKEINDKLGHAVGDNVLQDMSKRICSIVSSDMLFGRYGGDEFAIFLPGYNHDETLQIAEQIRQSIAESGEGIPSYTISVGHATVIPNQDTKLEQLYIKSDKALYLAKEQGRNCICCYTND